MVYNKLTYIRDAGTNVHNKRLWLLKCECGNVTTAVASQVRSGRTKSCGCLQAMRRSQGNPKHHGRGHPLYSTWCNMKTRCDNPRSPAYKNYGGRGISYDPAWASFPAFLADVGNPTFEGATLDRVDNNGPYAPNNVRWTDRVTQRRNSRAVRMVTLGDETRHVTDWCEHYGITIGAVHRRLKCGMTIEDAITRPKAKRYR